MSDKEVTVLTGSEPNEVHYHDDRQVHLYNDDHYYVHQVSRNTGWGNIGDMLWGIIQLWGLLFWIFMGYVAMKSCAY